MTAIHAVVAGYSYLSPPLAEIMMDDLVRNAHEGGDGRNAVGKLSARERQVLQLIAEGKSSAEVARALKITARTVDTHRHNIMTKLKIHSIAGLTKFAIQHGLSSLH